MNTQPIIDLALSEDFVTADVTSYAFSDQYVSAKIFIKEAGIICGIDVLKQVFLTVDNNLKIDLKYKDGDHISKKTCIATVSGSEKSIHAAERTALNFLSHLSGISTLTQALKQALNDNNIQVRDTRKTIPGLRDLEKYSVEIGGGRSQRQNLSDEILFKDNHWESLRKEGMSLSEYWEKTQVILKKKGQKVVPIQVEVETIEQLEEVLSIKPDLILLDNTDVIDIAKRSKKIREFSPNTLIEVSGGVTLDNISRYKGLDIDYISSGALTNSARSLDVGLDIIS